MITVYVPTFNRAAKLRECLTSLRLQTLDKSFFRVVVSDNASDDETPAVVEEFADLAIVHRRQSRNVGLIANWCGVRDFFDGEYVQFLSDDDLLAPFHLELCRRELQRRGDVGVCGTGVLYGAGLWESDTRRGDLRLGDRLLDSNDRCVHWTREGWLAAHSIYSAVNLNACLFRTEALRAIEPLFDASVAALTDRWMMAQVGLRTSCVTTPWPTCVLRVHGENAIHGTGLVDIEDVAREVAGRVLSLAEREGIDLVGYWKGYFRASLASRADVASLIHHAYPADLAARCLEGSSASQRTLDRWPVPAGLKVKLRQWRARLRRRLGGRVS
jgi:glycosyltransferase involved in cell wall biosynthesis